MDPVFLVSRHPLLSCSPHVLARAAWGLLLRVEPVVGEPSRCLACSRQPPHSLALAEGVLRLPLGT